jgi:hypothetical protein
MKKNIHFQQFKPYFFFLFIIIIAFWQIAFLQFSLKWDFLDCWVPWRNFIGDCLQEGIWPLWNPYQQLGYPIHADLQCPFWYPEILLIGPLFSYSIYTMLLVYILYLFIAASGFFRLSIHFVENKKIRILIALAYILSGFFVAHLQHFYSLISAAWLPWILYHYIDLCQKRNIKNILWSAILMFLMISGGNQTFTIITAYLMLSILIAFLISNMRKKDLKTIFSLLKANITFAFLALLFNLGTVIVLFQVGPYVQRLSGMALDTAAFNPFSPPSLISLFFPFATLTNMELFQSDISMRNIYFGMILLSFFLFRLRFIKRMKKTEGVFLIFGIFCLLLSFGKFLPLYKIAFQTIPLFDLFRFPSYFTLFSIISFLLLAAQGLEIFKTENKKHYKSIALIWLAFLSITLFFLVFSILKIDFPLTWNGNFFEAILAFSFYEHLFIHAFIQSLILIILLIISFRNKAGIKKYIFSFTIIEMIIAVQLHIFYTGVFEAKPNDIHRILSEKKNGFTIPDHTNLIDLNDNTYTVWPFWRNTGMLNKKISQGGFNSFAFTQYIKLTDNKELMQVFLHNPLIYLSDRIYPLSSLNDSFPKPKDHKNIYLEEQDYEKLKDMKIKNSAEDSLSIIGFRPGLIKIKVYSKQQQILTLLQSYYPGWKIKIDDSKLPLYKSNGMFLSCLIPAGIYCITISYSNPPVIGAVIISYILMIILIIRIYRKTE